MVGFGVGEAQFLTTPLKGIPNGKFLDWKRARKKEHTVYKAISFKVKKKLPRIWLEKEKAWNSVSPTPF